MLGSKVYHFGVQQIAYIQHVWVHVECWNSLAIRLDLISVSQYMYYNTIAIHREIPSHYVQETHRPSGGKQWFFIPNIIINPYIITITNSHLWRGVSAVYTYVGYMWVISLITCVGCTDAIVSMSTHIHTHTPKHAPDGLLYYYAIVIYWRIHPGRRAVSVRLARPPPLR